MAPLLSSAEEENALAFLSLGNPEPGTERFAHRCRLLLKRLSGSSPFYHALHQELTGELAQDLSLPHPFQPLVERDRHREFVPNALVQRIVRHTPWKHSPFLGRFSVWDRVQLAQLLGMRLSVFLTLPFVSSAMFRSMVAAAEPGQTSHPSQPLQLAHGELRFQPNALVQFLMRESGWRLEELDAFPASDADMAQLRQLLGLELSGTTCQGTCPR